MRGSNGVRGNDEAEGPKPGTALVSAALAVALVAAGILSTDPGGALEIVPTTTTTVVDDVDEADAGGFDVADDEPAPYPTVGGDDGGTDTDGADTAGEPPAQPDVPDGMGFTIEIHAGVDGRARLGRPAPVSVEIAAERLITGELRVVAEVGERTVVSARSIEVPGSSTKRFVITTPVEVGDADDLTVELEIDGETVISHAVSVETATDREIVGVMGLVAAPDSLPSRVELAVDAGSASLTGIDPETLGAGVGALAVFDAIVASAADLESLATREMEALSAWLTAGGQLMVDEADGPVPRLPDAWQPDPGDPRPAGFGLVRLTGGAAKTGAWESILVPTPIDDATEAGGYDLRTSTDDARGLDAVLTTDAGFTLPSITHIVVLLVLYAVVVGPLTFVVLRRRGRTERMWIAVPSLAALATIGVVVFGAGLRDTTGAAHLTVVVTGPGVDTATTHVLVDSGDPGISVPRGWHILVDANDPAATADARVVVGDETATARVDLAGGGHARVAASGPVEMAGLRVEATSATDGRVEGRVVNESDRTLHDVAVLVAAYGQSFGSLEPGEEREFDLGGVHGYELRADAAGILWASSRLADPTAWEAVLDDRGGVNSTSIGAVTAVGWTDEPAAPVATSDGATIRSGRTVLVAHEPIGAADETNMAVRLQIVRGPDGVGSFRATYQGLVGDVGGAERISVGIPRFAAEMAVWNGTRWQAIGTSGQETTRVFMTEDVVIDGLIHVRLDIDRRQIFEFANGRTLTVTLLQPADEDEGET